MKFFGVIIMKSLKQSGNAIIMCIIEVVVGISLLVEAIFDRITLMMRRNGGASACDT